MLSLIIPLYNNENTIDETLKSVVNQTIYFTEVIIVDNGSSDKSISLVEEYCVKYPYIRLISCEINGVSMARNKGIDEASSEYISFLDADDTIAPNYVETIKNAIMMNQSNDIYHFNFYQQFKNGIIKRNPYFLDQQNSYTGEQFRTETLKQFAFEAKHMVWTFVFSKSFLNKYEIRFNQYIVTLEDVLFLHKVWSFNPRIRIVSECLVLYRWNQHSITNNQLNQNVIQAFSELYIEYSNIPIVKSYIEKLSSRLLSRQMYYKFWHQQHRNRPTSYTRLKCTYLIFRVKQKIKSFQIKNRSL